MEDSCADCVHSRMYESDQQDMPVFKCHRYPPQLFYDGDGEVGQAFPDAWMSCGEFKSAEKTTRVIGTLRKVKNYGTRISASAIGYCRHLRRGRTDSQSRDQADSATSDEPCS